MKDNHKTKGRRDILLNASLLFLTIILCALFAELVIRLIPQLHSSGYRPSKNEKIVYELYPGYRMKSLNSWISRQGLHDRYFPLKKGSGVHRIAILGDSTSFGWKAGLKNSFPKTLEKMLNATGNKKCEVINFSVPGYNTAQEYEILKEKVIKFSPNIVILVYCENDTHLCNYIKPKVTLLNYLYHKSYLVHLILKAIDYNIKEYSPLRHKWLSFKKKILGMFYYEQRMERCPGLEETIYINGNPPASKSEVPSEYWYMLGYDNYKIHLTNIYNFLKSYNIKFISCGFFDKETLRINQGLGAGNICDFYQYLSAAGKQRKDFALSDKDGHLNAQGHIFIARVIYDFLKERGL